jgi:uncharacterized protein
MLISVLDIERDPIVFNLAVDSGTIDYGPEVTQVSPLAVEGRADLIQEDRGAEKHSKRVIVEDIRLQGIYSGDFEIACARCLAPVDRKIQGQFDLLFRPLGVDQGAPERSISADETEIGYYEQSGLMLEDVLREQVLLSLPARTLCREDCKGLCPRCGRDLNSETCTCDTAPADPRWAALSGLASRIKT